MNQATPKFTEMKMSQIKPLTVEQLPAVVELDRLCFGGLWTIEGYRQELFSPTSNLLVVSVDAASQGLKVNETLVGVGCLWAILDEAHITILGVHPDYRHQGLGQLLLEVMLQVSRRRGLKRATLEVKASNQAALSLYQKFGFQEAGRRRGYYKDTGEDALILWRSGIQTSEMGEKLAQWHKSISDRLTTSGWHMSVEWDALTNQEQE